MAKRKAPVNDIIYELDNDDVEISSEDEVKEPKIKCVDVNTEVNTEPAEPSANDSCIEVVNISSPCEEIQETSSESTLPNGGKILELDENISPPIIEIEATKPVTNDISKTTILNEDIVIDSPASNSDLGVVGCENRTPLITVRFRDTKLASNYKEKIKAFMLSLIKLHDEEFSLSLNDDTDLELDIWPEDLCEEDMDIETAVEPEDSLFFVDTAPTGDDLADVPAYSQTSCIISNAPPREPTPPPVVRRGLICFNCDSNHSLRDCPLPRNNAKIAEKRKNMAVRVGRYHVEDEQKYGHLVPGRISGNLRHALGLKRHELPLHIYRMRLLGYPPGWLEEARISHSGITMFDSAGNAILDPEEEDGEVCEPGSKDKFDIKKILDFPGFNVPASPRYKEEAHLIGLPAMSEQDSKLLMLQMLAPNAMKAYKRKKLAFFPSAAIGEQQTGQAEMELDSGDEVAEFPSIPPLPDEAPPPPPPPPSAPPPPPDSPAPPLVSPPPKTSLPTPPNLPPPQPISSPPTPLPKAIEHNDSADDIEVIKVMKVVDIPVPNAQVITIDEDQPSSGRGSPSLDDLERKKRLLLDALEGNSHGTPSVISDADVTSIDLDTSATEEIEVIDMVQNESLTDQETEDKIETNDTIETVGLETCVLEPGDTLETDTKDEAGPPNDPQEKLIEEVNSPILNKSDLSRTPDQKAGNVKTTLYGTPVMNIASSYVKLPSDDKFAKDICDVINFENLPNSTGKYEQIKTLLKKVKSEVDRIHES